MDEFNPYFYQKNVDLHKVKARASNKDWKININFDKIFQYRIVHQEIPRQDPQNHQGNPSVGKLEGQRTDYLRR